MNVCWKAVRYVLALALIVTMTCGLGAVACAAADSATLDFTQTGSVCLTLEDGDGNAVTDGAVTLYQVAALCLEDGDMAYRYTEAFSGCTETLDVEDTSLAASLADYVAASGIGGTTAALGADGTARFDTLALGLYLVVQTGQSTGYNSFSPFLVTVPYAEGGCLGLCGGCQPKGGTHRRHDHHNDHNHHHNNDHRIL